MLSASFLVLVVQLTASVCCARGGMKVITKVTCPNGCSCVELSADCRGDNHIYQEAINNLPRTVENFTFTILIPKHPHSVIVDLSAGNLSRLHNLLEFRIQPPSLNLRHLAGFSVHQTNTTEVVFCGLKRLNVLHLNANFIVPSPSLNGKSFDCLRKLKILDLSYTQKLPATSTRAILSAPLSRDIDALLLRNIQTFGRTGVLQTLDFARLFTGVNRAKLEVLDLAENAFIRLSPGILLMTRLRKLDLSGNLLFSTAHLNRIPFYEIFLHPSLQEVIAENQELIDKYLGGTRANADQLGGDVSGQRDNGPHDRAAGPDDNLLFSRPRDDAVGPDENLLFSRPRDDAVGPGDTLSYSGPLSGSKVLNVIFKGARKLSKVLLPAGKVHSSGCLYNVTFPAGNVHSSGCLYNVTFPIGMHLQVVDISGFLKEAHPFQNRQPPGRVCFSSHNVLRKLDILNNRLDQFIDEPHLSLFRLSGLDQVVSLRAEKNNLPLDISGHLLGSFPALRTLLLAGNRVALTRLNETMTRTIDRYAHLEVDMGDNNFVCGCSTLKFVEWVHETNKVLTNRDALKCLEGVEQKLLLHIDVSKLNRKCNPLTTLQVSLIAVFSTVCLFSLGFLVLHVYRKRWRIRYFLYRRRLKRQRADRELGDEHEYEYDAFVSFCDGSSYVREWTQTALMVELQDKQGLRLFVPQNDVLPCQRLLQEIDAGMGKSRKVLLILSPEYLTDWRCMYEAWEAQTTMLSEDRDAVVMVKLQPLPLGGLSGTLTSLMEMRECLTWTEDPVGQELFWEKVMDALLSRSGSLPYD